MDLLAVALLFCLAAAAPTVEIGADATVPPQPRASFSRLVNARPGHGEAVDLNPPRFSWRYHPKGWRGPERTFRFQIAATPDFAAPVVDEVVATNFHNALAPLPGAGPWYWRVARGEGAAAPTAWGSTRSFTIAPDAQVWDRSALADPDLASHPRILFTADSLPAIRRLRETHDESRQVFEAMQKQADRAVDSKWWADFPDSDADEHRPLFLQLANELTLVAFVWRITGDDKYAGVVDRAVTLASYPQGGRSSPEGAGGESNEDSTQINEFVALLYDWLHPDLTPAQRKVFVDSLAWRGQFWLDNWLVKRKGEVRDGTLMVSTSSHAYEGSMDTAAVGVALQGEHPVGDRLYDLMANYLVGVTNGMGYDESWNEGPGYGNSKMKWLMHALWYYQTAVPEVDFGANPALVDIGDFFARITPVNMPFSPWGNIAGNQRHVESNRSTNFRKLAYLTGEGRFLRNWRETGYEVTRHARPWIEYVLPYHGKTIDAEPLEDDPVKLFATGGWVTAASHPASSRDAWDEAVGLVFQARPRGGYSHSFNSDNGIQLYAYGQLLNHPGGSTLNGDAYAYHTMSHDTVLIDGLGQAQNDPEAAPAFARVVGFDRGPRHVYLAGDATWAYPREPGEYRRWSLPLAAPYTERAADHLRRFVRHVLFVDNRYFVIYDDLEASRPAVWTWLYHILPAEPFAFDAERFTVDYAVDDVRVRVVHAAQPDRLTLDDRRGNDGAVNPLTGEDWRKTLADAPMPAHNLWVSSPPAVTWRFLTVVCPTRPGGAAPAIERIDDDAVRVGGDVISFDGRPREGATFVIDAAAMRGLNEPDRLLALEPEGAVD